MQSTKRVSNIRRYSFAVNQPQSTAIVGLYSSICRNIGREWQSVISRSHLEGESNSMGLSRIVCLANSYKHDHRCVTGINLETKRWVRLVGNQVPGCLTLREISYPDGRDVALLDVFEAELGEGCGSNCHPEDVYVTGSPWRPVRRFDGPAEMRFLEAYQNKSPSLLQGYGDRVYTRKIEGSPVDKSLDLIRPEDLW